VDFKLDILVYKALHCLEPPYITLLRLSVGGGSRLTHLRSADTRTYVIPTRTLQFGDRSFAVAGPRVWNSLPAPFRDIISALPLSTHSAVEMLHDSALYKFMIDIDIDINSIYRFRKQLKTYLF